MSARPLSRELAEESVGAVNTAGTISDAARNLGIPDSTIRSRLKAAKQLYDLAPEHPVPPDGFKTAGISTLYNKTTGQPIIEWVKLTADAKRQEEIFREVIDELTANLPRTPPIPPPDHTTENLMALYPIGDHHLGMLSWHEETGADYDIAIGEKLLTGAMDHLVGATPACDEAVVIFLGDYLHYDSWETVTPTNRNPLDADGRFPKMVRAGIRTMRYLIDAALKHHARVRLIVEIGNHDLASSIFLVECMAAVYDDEPRLTVDTAPGHYHYINFGKCLVGTHHGHGVKMDKLPLVMATDKASEWGKSEYRYWYTGHIHIDSVKDYSGCRVESFRVLCPTDAWAYNKGYRPAQNMKAIMLHREFGEVARYIVNPSMLL